MPVPTPQQIEDAIAEDALAGIATSTSDGQTATLMSTDDRLALADRAAAAAAALATGGNAWGAVGRARAMPNWNE